MHVANFRRRLNDDIVFNVKVKPDQPMGGRMMTAEVQRGDGYIISVAERTGTDVNNEFHAFGHRKCSQISVAEPTSGVKSISGRSTMRGRIGVTL